MFRPGTLATCAFLMGMAGLALPWRIFYAQFGGRLTTIPEWGAYRIEPILFALLLAPCGLLGPIRLKHGSRTWSFILVTLFGSLGLLLGGLLLTFFALDARNDAAIGCYVQTTGAIFALTDGIVGLTRAGSTTKTATRLNGPWIPIGVLFVVLVLLTIAYGSGLIG